jgi:hypothetical protein
MVGAGDAVSLEDQVGLGVFIREGILGDPVVFEELSDFHAIVAQSGSAL